MPAQTLFKSLRLQWLALTLALLVLGGYIAWNLLAERAAIDSQERDRLAGQARVVEENMVRQLEATSSALMSVRKELAYFKTQRNQQELLTRHLQNLRDAMPGVRTLSVLDAQGTVLASNREELVARNFANRDYVRAVQQRPHAELLYVSAPFKTALGVYSINLTRAEVDAQGQMTRIVTATLDPEFFSILMDSVRYAPDMWTALAHGDGMVVNHLPARPAVLGVDLDKPGTLFRRHMDSAQHATLLEGHVATTGTASLMAQRTIAPKALNMDRPLVVAVARSQSAIFAGWRRKASMALALSALLGLISVVSMRLYQQHQRALFALVIEKEGLRRKADEEIKKLAYYDALTGLPNRRLLLDRLHQLQSANLRHHRHSALLFIDLDNFKSLNDEHGHGQGDLLLQQVAQRLAACVRDEDTVARLGGDEFVVMLCELDGQRTVAAAQAQAVAHKILQVMNQDFAFDGFSHPFGASIGVTLFGDQPEAVDEVFRRADQAMYQAKTAGRNSFRMSGEHGAAA